MYTATHGYRPSAVGRTITAGRAATADEIDRRTPIAERRPALVIHRIDEPSLAELIPKHAIHRAVSELDFPLVASERMRRGGQVGGTRRTSRTGRTSRTRPGPP